MADTQSEFMRVDVNDGKYTVVMSQKGELKALRYGEEWRDCCGDNLIYWLAMELLQTRGVVEQAKEYLSNFEASPLVDELRSMLGT